MKQLPRGSQKIHLRGVLLYLEDFLAIVQLFRETCDVVEVTADGFALDDPPTEISQLKERLNRSEVYRLKIDGTHLDPVDPETQQRKERLHIRPQKKYPSVATLGLDNGWGYVEYDDDDPKAKGLSRWILERLTYRTLGKLVTEYPRMNVLISAATTVPLVVTVFQNNRSLVLFAIAWFLAGIMSNLLLWWLLFREKPAPVLRLEKRSDRTTFLSRNKDQIVLMIVTAVVTASLAVVTTLFVQSLKSPTQKPPSTSTTQTTK